MYGKLLEFLRVSSLDPEFSIKCPDPEVLPSWVTERNSRSFHDICVIQYYRTAIQNQNQNQNQNQFEIIRNSSTVPVPEFQYCPEFQNFRTPPQRLTRIPASVAEGGVVGQEIPRVRARAARARPSQYSDPV